jgi:acyl dehydratase
MAYFGGVIASGWHTAALMMRIYSENDLSEVANLDSPGGDEPGGNSGDTILIFLD